MFKLLVSCFIGKQKIIITKVLSNYYDLSCKDSFIYIQLSVRIFGENLEYERNLYTFKTSSIWLKPMLSEENKLTKELKSKLNGFHDDDNITYNIFKDENDEDNIDNDIDKNKLELENLIKK